MHDVQYEDLRQKQIETKEAIEKLVPLLENVIKVTGDRPEVQKVMGQLQVNTEKEVSVTNLDALQRDIEALGDVLSEVIKNNAHKPLESVSVKNLPKDIKVNNIEDIAPLLIEAIKELDIQPVVNVQKQTLEFPTLAKDAIPVRLSDGKSFYKAMFSAYSSAQTEADPLVGYQITDEQTIGSSTYYGYLRKNGAWYIMKETNGTYRYMTGVPQPQGGNLYIDAWTNKVNLAYGYFHEVFDA